MVAVLPPDTELFLCTWLRSEANRLNLNIEVGNQEPETLTFPLTRPLVIVRDDGGPQSSPITYERTIGLTVLGGSRRDAQATMDLARTMYALATSTQACLAEGSPLVAIDHGASQPPYRVADEADTTRAYMTIEATVQGTDIHQLLENNE